MPGDGWKLVADGKTVCNRLCSINIQWHAVAVVRPGPSNWWALLLTHAFKMSNFQNKSNIWPAGVAEWRTRTHIDIDIGRSGVVRNGVRWLVVNGVITIEWASWNIGVLRLWPISEQLILKRDKQTRTVVKLAAIITGLCHYVRNLMEPASAFCQNPVISS